MKDHLKNINFSYVMKFAARKQDIELLTYISENHLVKEYYQDALCTLLEKSNMEIIDFILQKINKESLQINELLKSACCSGKWSNFKFLADKFQNVIHTLNPNELMLFAFKKKNSRFGIS